MLAPNFKTAKELFLSDAQHNALIQVLGMLEREEITNTIITKWDTTSASLFVARHTYKPVKGFKGLAMIAVESEAECGTVCCLQGWAEKFSSKTFRFNLGWPMAATTLFMYGDRRRDDVTAEQATCALRNYLTTGSANWNQILGE